MRPVTGGPADGQGLYPEDRQPCLVCGDIVATDWDGVLVWHYRGKPSGPLAWCSGSRTILDVSLLDG